MRISDWSSDVCSSDLPFIWLHDHYAVLAQPFDIASGSGMFPHADIHGGHSKDRLVRGEQERCGKAVGNAGRHLGEKIGRGGTNDQEICLPAELYMTHFRLILQIRSEEHTSELPSLMRHSYAVF